MPHINHHIFRSEISHSKPILKVKHHQESKLREGTYTTSLIYNIMRSKEFIPAYKVVMEVYAAKVSVKHNLTNKLFK